MCNFFKLLWHQNDSIMSVEEDSLQWLLFPVFSTPSCIFFATALWLFLEHEIVITNRKFHINADCSNRDLRCRVSLGLGLGISSWPKHYQPYTWHTQTNGRTAHCLRIVHNILVYAVTLHCTAHPLHLGHTRAHSVGVGRKWRHCTHAAVTRDTVTWSTYESGGVVITDRLGVTVRLQYGIGLHDLVFQRSLQDKTPCQAEQSRTKPTGPETCEPRKPSVNLWVERSAKH